VAIIERTTVHPSLRPAFLGYAAAVMLVALGAAGCSDVWNPPSAGITPAPPAVHEVPRADNVTRSVITIPIDQLSEEEQKRMGIIVLTPGGCRADLPNRALGAGSAGIRPQPTPLTGSGGIRVDVPPTVQRPKEGAPKPEAPKPPTLEEKRQRAKEAETALERFQQDHPRVAEYIRISDRIRLYRDNPSAPSAQEKLAAEESRLKALGDVSEDDVAAYKEQWARLLDAMRKAKVEAAK
jgi:hypothetical protein